MRAKQLRDMFSLHYEKEKLSLGPDLETTWVSSQSHWLGELLQAHKSEH